jgi:dihydrofolate reductase
MRKLKLQVQISVDGFICGPNGEMDWLTWSWNDDIKNYVTEITDSVDTILLGRKMAPGFIGHWTNVLTNPSDESYPFAKKMIDKPKVVFTKTLDRSEWENTTLAKGELADEIKKLKDQPGKDIIVYGGAGFDSSLIKEKLVDELHLFMNPAVIGEGLPIFKNISAKQGFKLVKSIPFECGIVLLHYELQ